ncbi:MAG: SGNH/GDSL hydrolase family protein [Deltaproteobacteria bacterium]|nr:SGNH/GDSL hydrolase family protein [Deltaproteobacteria bacterium]
MRSLGSHRAAAIALGLGIGAIVASILVWTLGSAREEARRAPELGTRIVGLHRLDDEIGYVLRPGSKVRHHVKQFDVEYRVDEDGSRHVPGSERGRPRVLVFGDSWTFGHGVTDDETYAARLQEHWPDVAVRNFGTMGYGTAHTLLLLERLLAASEGDVDLVLYGWTPIHLGRSYLRASNLAVTASKRAPRLEIENGRLVSKGLADQSEAIADGTPGLARAEWSRTMAAIRRMAKLADEKGARFVLVTLPGPEDDRVFPAHSERLRKRLGPLGVEVIDLDAAPDVSKDLDLFIPNDAHPNARWNAMVADAIAARLDPSPISRW